MILTKDQLNLLQMNRQFVLSELVTDTRHEIITLGMLIDQIEELSAEVERKDQMLKEAWKFIPHLMRPQFNKAIATLVMKKPEATKEYWEGKEL